MNRTETATELEVMDSSPTSPGMATVLVVENDAGNRDVFRRILERAGFEVVTAEDGRVALAEVGQRGFHAILCDVNMPRLNGLGFYAVLRELFPEVASRVIFISAVTN